MHTTLSKSLQVMKSVLLAATIAATVTAQAATVNLATAPLANSTTGTVHPNLMFILDDSGSMNWTYMPDDVNDFSGKFGIASSHCNGVYYDPTITYSPPKKADGTSYPNQDPTQVSTDGFASATGTLRLVTVGTSTPNYVNPVTGASGLPVYYQYTGSITTPNYTVGSSFYNECNSTDTTKFTLKTVTSSTELVNFANWYAYYRKRILMMKTAASQAFANVGTNFRVGYMSINNNTGSDFLNVALFDATQKAAWYNKLFAAKAGNSTPLRSALSTAGLLYAGKMNGQSFNGSTVTDPMEYSCQQNFTLLSTDGFWNTGNDSGCSGRGGLGCKIDKTSAVGEQDGAGVARPMYDGALATSTKTDVWGRTLYSISQPRGCRAPSGMLVTANQQQTHQVVTSNGVVISDTTTNWTTVSSTTGSCQNPAPTLPSPNPTATTLLSSTTAATSSGGSSDSLADVAMYYYTTDLRDTSLGNCTSGSTSSDVCKNNVPGAGDDKNAQQHMTTFTLGLGVNGTMVYSPTYATDTSGDYYNIKIGSANWPVPTADNLTAVDDLWHAAVDGHGTYFSARNPTALVSSLNTALAGMSARLGYGTAAATSNLQPVNGDNFIYVASYTTANWVGNLQAQTVDPTTGAISAASTWCAENIPADPVLNTPACNGTMSALVGSTSDTRTIYAFKNGAANNLRSFTWANLDAATEQPLFNPNKLSQWSTSYTAADQAAATGDKLVNFLRGQYAYETQNGTIDQLFRDRSTTFGDVVDSQPVYVKKPSFQYTDAGYSAFVTANASRAASIYVGSNDGMLHAFDATNGVERWAYIPTPVMPNLYWLADFTYSTNHHYYVNGTTTVADVCVASCTDPANAQWRTILVGGLGGGGRGFYALDVTNPATPKALWEFTSTSDNDLGYSYGNPLVVKKSDGTWVVVVTSGYNNVSPGSGHGFVYVLNPLTGGIISKIDTGAGSTTTPSGLSRLAAWADDPQHNATATALYGGDLLGNVWKIDINTGNVSLLANLTGPTGVAQPITTRPELASINGSKVVFVATGKYLEASDLDSTKFTVQSAYAIKDDGTTLVSPRTALVQQTLTNSTGSGGQIIRTVTANAVDFSTKRGWFVDFPDPGERNNVDMQLALGTLLIPTNVPTNGVCEAGGYSWLNFLNYKTGSYVPGATMAAVGTGNSMITGVNLLWINGVPVPYITTTGGAPQLVSGPKFSTGSSAGVHGHRVSWRELIEE